MKKIIITGGSGFIGNNLTIRSKNLGYNVSVLSLNEVEFNKRILSVTYIQADINNIIQLRKKISKEIYRL